MTAAARRQKGPLERATERSVREARATKVIGPLDVAAIEAMKALARKIDAWDEIVRWAQEDADLVEGARPAVPQHDNVSLSSYLKYAEQLGLTPAGRNKLPEQQTAGGSGGKLRGLPAVPRPA